MLIQEKCHLCGACEFELLCLEESEFKCMLEKHMLNEADIMIHCSERTKCFNKNTRDQFETLQDAFKLEFKGVINGYLYFYVLALNWNVFLKD